MPDSAPGGKPQPPRRRTGLLLSMILVVLAAVLLLVFVLQLARQPNVKNNVGSQEFSVGRASAFAPLVAAHGPLIFPPLRGSITLYVQHLGSTPAEGWLAFDAHDPNAGPKCLVHWRAATHDFVDPCNQAAFPPDGQGLNQYATRIDSSGDIIVNLRQSTGTTPPTS